MNWILEKKSVYTDNYYQPELIKETGKVQKPEKFPQTVEQPNIQEQNRERCNQQNKLQVKQPRARSEHDWVTIKTNCHSLKTNLEY